jgi:hypothetical protein
MNFSEDTALQPPHLDISPILPSLEVFLLLVGLFGEEEAALYT